MSEKKVKSLSIVSHPLHSPRRGFGGGGGGGGGDIINGVVPLSHNILIEHKA